MKPTKPPSPEIYFDRKSGQYWIRFSADSRFLNLDSRNVKLHLRRLEWHTEIEDDYGLKEGDKALLTAQLERAVDYAGPLAGHSVGVITTQGRRVLVTSEATPIKAKAGSTEHLEKFLGELLGSTQCERFLYWLKMGRESLLKGDFRPGQMVVLAGPSSCGKSFLQSLITEFLGGRMAKPYRYMTGATQFNSDLAGAEHLVIADEQASIDIRSRRNFGSAVKDLTVNLDMSLHAKGREAITLPTAHRISLSVNNETENLSILPPMDESILDKIMLLLCAPAELGPDRTRNWKTFTAELPALAHMLERLSIPRTLRDNRYGVRAYHNPELLDIVSDISPEMRLLSLIDGILFDQAKDQKALEFWRGTAIELEGALRKSEFSFAVEKLLSFSSAAGTYLDRLAHKFPARFGRAKNGGKTLWTIKPQEGE